MINDRAEELIMAEPANSFPEKDKWIVGPGWRLVEEPRDTQLASGKIFKDTAFGIRRENDGFTMIWEAGGFMGEFEVFSCKGENFTKFEFVARRRDLPEDPPLDIYIVEISISQSPAEIILKHAKDIKAALLAFPATNNFDYIPAKDVKFDLGKGYERLILSADEAQI